MNAQLQHRPNLPGSSFLNPADLILDFGLQPGMKVADFGSGSAHFTILLAQTVGEGGQVTAVDILESALDVVRSKANQAGFRNIQTVRSNLEVPNSSGLGEASQDFVLLANILFQSDKKAVIIKEAFRVLKSGGTAVIIDWRVDGAEGVGPDRAFRVDATQMQTIAEEAGFLFKAPIEAGTYHYGLIFSKNGR
ncbi:MAG: hypothetical protein COV31_02890 [Candidatus Yanofskybacteria bacterium CG10_big_fil_rev_8_21_14_0_10_46_23]|uniref:Methyltransferase domain-containing protein n=1 Tax=Candidatus Yanofskybacteria bacterium CG10_big_fil_rev_8_21_14_0_10_46_23 TaxID=1975098 RepID=A0A2H0R4V8_9BACT|nr:MAG: hypothetical protein COV31_02890 [Candidatus Yanofskybacteria bacterium CG10_big_fil_rev_8_21_14_0_10_46_23]